jgi:hypothetical protein
MILGIYKKTAVMFMWKFTELQKSSETMHGKNALDFLKFSEAQQVST